MMHYIVSSGEIGGSSSKFVQLKNVYSCNTVYIKRIIITNFSSEDCKVQVLKNVESAGAGATPRKGTSTDLCNNTPSRATLIYNPKFTDLFNSSNVIFDTLCQPGNLVIDFENSVICKPGSSLCCLLKGDDKNDQPLSVKYEFDELSSCSSCCC